MLHIFFLFFSIEPIYLNTCLVKFCRKYLTTFCLSRFKYWESFPYFILPKQSNQSFKPASFFVENWSGKIFFFFILKTCAPHLGGWIFLRLTISIFYTQFLFQIVAKKSTVSSSLTSNEHISDCLDGEQLSPGYYNYLINGVNSQS